MRYLKLMFLPLLLLAVPAFGSPVSQPVNLSLNITWNFSCNTEGAPPSACSGETGTFDMVGDFEFSPASMAVGPLNSNLGFDFFLDSVTETGNVVTFSFGTFSAIPGGSFSVSYDASNWQEITNSAGGTIDQTIPCEAGPGGVEFCDVEWSASNPAPECPTLVLLATGMLGLGFSVRRLF